MTSRHKLSVGPLSLELLPEVGGAIGSLHWQGPQGGVHLMRRAGGAKDALTTANFPLVPFSNRVSGGSFEFQGRRVSLPPNMLPHPTPLHGQGWRHPWRVDYEDGRVAILTYRHRPSDWPWAYEAEQKFTLTSDSLVVALSLQNLSPSPMPAGIGLHPYFPRDADTRLRANLPRVWRGRPGEQALQDVAPEWDFRRPRAVDGLRLDHCFDGWDGRAEIEWQAAKVRLRIEAESIYSRVVIYTPRKQDYFCFEPVTNANDAFNLMHRAVAGHGVQILAPGEQLRGSVRFSVEGA